jgi:hypothetical protein
MSQEGAALRMARLFLLSPASCHGRRAQILLNPLATFDLACRLRSQGVTLSEAFSFLSGLYFRGKLAYAQRFATWSCDGVGVQVITAGRGLLPASTVITDDSLRAFVDVPVDPKDERYLAPLVEGAKAIETQLKRSDEVVLLGSIATDKYCGPLGEVFGDRLRFPSEFIGRGDMSRGGLMLRCVDAGEELTYIPLAGAVRKGTRPAKLPKRTPK